MVKKKVIKEKGIVEKLSSTFDFLGGEDTPADEIATGGNPDAATDPAFEAPKGPVPIHQGLTKEQVLTAQSRAGSRKGLDIDAFVNETGIPQLDIDQLLKFKV